MMATKPKTRRRRADGLATRQRILDESLRLFAAGGYEATSLRQIASAASIDIATLKYHYPDKSDLFGQVYAQGHGEFVAVITPIMMQLGETTSRAEVRDVVDVLVVTIHDFVEAHTAFVKLTLFRLMEDSLDVIGLEDQLQSQVLAAIESVFASLIEREIIESVDARAVVVFLITSFSMWYVTALVKPGWMGEPALTSKEGRARSEAFFKTTIERMLGVEA